MCPAGSGVAWEAPLPSTAVGLVLLQEGEPTLTSHQALDPGLGDTLP